MKTSAIYLCAVVISTSLLACADAEETDTSNAPLNCAIDLPREECEAAGCTLETTRWGVDQVDQALPQACEFEAELSKSCLPLKAEPAGDSVTYFQRELPNGDRELVSLSSHYPPDVLDGWSGCWMRSDPIPEDSGYVECRCDY